MINLLIALAALVAGLAAFGAWQFVSREVRRWALLQAPDASEEGEAEEQPESKEAFIGGIGEISATRVDVLLVGAGAMGTTLGMLLHQLDPSLDVCMVEQLDQISMESTDALNNAGTGHAGFCELNYTPMAKDGTINTKKAFSVNTGFEVSLQYWSSLVEAGCLTGEFIHQVPHLSFVDSAADVEFLRKRQHVLKDSVAFGDMVFTDDHGQMREWMPLFMQGRDASEHLAATRVRYGTDVNFGVLARSMAAHLVKQDHFDLRLRRSVLDLQQRDDGRWMVEVANLETGATEIINAGFVFLGAGGGALPLLQKSGIPEGKGYGGFPVGGQWLICDKPEIVNAHTAKVYGKAAIGAPPMSVPHLDTRHIDGKRLLLFGPYAGFSTRYLKTGSLLDLPTSFTPANVIPMITAGLQNVDLTLYLINEVMQTASQKCDTLRRYYKAARDDDWELENAGQRVQIIKRQSDGTGKLEFGTEVVSAEDGTLAALLGASPGASTAVKVMVDVLERCFSEQLKQESWQKRLKELIPSYGEELLENDELFRSVRERNLKVLEIDQFS